MKLIKALSVGKLGILFFATVASIGVFADGNTRLTNPSAVVVELGGRGPLYSVAFDRVLSDRLVAGIGLGSVSTSGSNQSSLLLPAYANFYFMPDAGSLYATVGVTLVTSPNSVSGLNSSIGNLQFSNTPLVGTFGLGYEYRSDAGYLVRATVYGLVAQTFAPWGGLSFGYSF